MWLAAQKFEKLHSYAERQNTKQRDIEEYGHGEPPGHHGAMHAFEMGCLGRSNMGQMHVDSVQEKKSVACSPPAAPQLCIALRCPRSGQSLFLALEQSRHAKKGAELCKSRQPRKTEKGSTFAKTLKSRRQVEGRANRFATATDTPNGGQVDWDRKEECNNTRDDDGEV
eukprot:gene11651-biopygen22906